MDIFVTGSQSFIGRRLVSLARQRGLEVCGVDRLAGEPDDVVLDVRDRGLGAAIPEGTKAVVHLAAVSRDVDCRNDPAGAFDINVGGTLNVAQACIERGVKQLIFASTEWVYGEIADGSPQLEDQAIDVNRISGEYALSKIVGERVLTMAMARGLSALTILRFGIVYGPRDANWSAVEALFHQVAEKPSISVGSLATARRFIHVDDIATGILAAVGREGREVFNLSGDRLVALREIIEESGRIHGTAPEVAETNPGAASIRNPDNAKAVAQLGWRPAIELAAGLRTLLQPVPVR